VAKDHNRPQRGGRGGGNQQRNNVQERNERNREGEICNTACSTNAFKWANDDWRLNDLRLIMIAAYLDPPR